MVDVAEEQASREAITRLVFEYAERQDAGDFEGVGRLFEHGPFEATGGQRWQGEEIAKWRGANVVLRADGTAGTRHMTTNLQIAITESGDHAEARSYFTILRDASEGESRKVVLAGAGRYLDRFERVDGSWRFAHRRAVVDLRGALDRHRRTAASQVATAKIPGASDLPPLPVPSGDYEAIEALIYRYAERLDLGDLEGVGGLFERGDYIGASGRALRGEPVADGLRGFLRLYDGLPLTKHITTNVDITLDGGAAEARSYWVLLQETDNLPLQPIAAGRYEDRFARGDGGWHFERRQIVMDMHGDLSHHVRRGEREHAS